MLLQTLRAAVNSTSCTESCLLLLRYRQSAIDTKSRLPGYSLLQGVDCQVLLFFSGLKTKTKQLKFDLSYLKRCKITYIETTLVEEDSFKCALSSAETSQDLCHKTKTHFVFSYVAIKCKDKMFCFGFFARQKTLFQINLQ